MPAEVSAGIDALRPGAVVLRVPLRDGAIQVGTSETLPSAAIEVRTGASAVSVRRTDGSPLQAQIIHRRPDGVEERATVFAEPVAALRLRWFGDPAMLWAVTDDAEAYDDAGLAQLVTTIVGFAVAKQRRLADTAETARPA